MPLVLDIFWPLPAHGEGQGQGQGQGEGEGWGWGWGWGWGVGVVGLGFDLLGLAIAHEAMHVDGVEGGLARELGPEHHHARHLG